MTLKLLQRAESKSRLAAISEDDRDAAGSQIVQRVLELPEMANVRTAMLYASLPSEVPTDALADALRSRGVRVTYPRCLPASREMSLHAIESGGDLLVDGPFGIREPAPNIEMVAVSEVDLAVIPGLAWDRRGYRLGRGAGYYDRLLADPAWRGIRLGAFFGVQEVHRVESDPWDVPMDLIVTENETARFTV